MRAILQFNNGEISVSMGYDKEFENHLERSCFDALIESVGGRGSLLEAIIKDRKIVIRKVKENVKPE